MCTHISVYIEALYARWFSRVYTSHQIIMCRQSSDGLLLVQHLLRRPNNNLTLSVSNTPYRPNA